MSGRDNFDEQRFEYFRDSTVALEAIQGRSARLAHRRTAPNPGRKEKTAYDFPRHQGEPRPEGGIPDPQPRHHAGLRVQHAAGQVQGRAPAPRVQLYAFDFEEMNKQIFYGQYTRVASYFEGHRARLLRPAVGPGAGHPGGGARQGAARGLPPPPYANPVGGTPEAVRTNLREGLRLLREAGYEVRNQKLVNAKTGEPVVVGVPGGRPEFRAASHCSSSPRSSA